MPDFDHSVDRANTVATRSESSKGNATENDARRAIEQVTAFLRMTAIELRRIVSSAPDITARLNHIADQLDAEADHLSRQIQG